MIIFYAFTKSVLIALYLYNIYRSTFPSVIYEFHRICFGLFCDVNVLAYLFVLKVQTDLQTDFEIWKNIELDCIILILLYIKYIQHFGNSKKNRH